MERSINAAILYNQKNDEYKCGLTDTLRPLNLENNPITNKYIKKIFSRDATKANILWASKGKGRNRYVNICIERLIELISIPPSQSFQLYS